MEQNGMISIDFCLMVQNGWWFRFYSVLRGILDSRLRHGVQSSFRAGKNHAWSSSQKWPQIEPFFDPMWFHMHHTSHMNWDRCVPHLLPITSVERPLSSKLLQIIWTKRETAAQRLNRSILPPCLMLPMHITWRFQLPKAEIDVCCLFNLQTMDIEGRMCKQYLQCLQLRETKSSSFLKWVTQSCCPSCKCLLNSS